MGRETSKAANEIMVGTFMDVTEDDTKLAEEINAAPLSGRFLLLHKLFTESVRFKWHDEIYQTDGNPVEVTNPEYLVILGKLLKEFAENDGKLKI